MQNRSRRCEWVTPDNPLIAALEPITSRVRTDVTAVRRLDGLQAWTKQALTPERLAKHYNGGPARGVCPIKAGESVTMLGLLDFDSHKGETNWATMSHTVWLVASALELCHGAVPVLFRSTGGRGVHLYVLWDDPQDAYSVRTWLAEVLRSCGLRPGVKSVSAGQVEVFPKQDAVAPDGFGNQFILPLACKSELLQFEELSGILEIVPRESVVGMHWPMSPPVPVVERPEHQRGLVARSAERDTPWMLALDAIPNSGTATLDYDAWRNVVFAVHYETGGSPEGLSIVEEFSARSAKADLDFLRERVWPFVRSDHAQPITGNTIMAMARGNGWQEPLDDSAFSVLTEEGEGVEDAGVAESAAPVRRRGVPAAEHKTTDQANANRLVKAYGHRALCAGDKWYIDDGKRWALDEAGIYRYACQLSRIVGDEARVLLQRAKEKTE